MEVKITKHIIGKVRLDEHGSGYFLDEDNHTIAELRGWGRIQNLGLKDPDKFQDDVGNWIAEAINEKLEREANEKVLKANGRKV
jgi:hypothetical protein